MLNPTLAERYTAVCHALNRDEWAPGMLRLSWAPSKPYHLQPSGRVPEGADMYDYDRDPVVPDFNDPATLGWLLAAVREVWGSEVVDCRWADSGDDSWGWQVHHCNEPRGPWRRTEAEALVAALELSLIHKLQCPSRGTVVQSLVTGTCYTVTYEDGWWSLPPVGGATTDHYRSFEEFVKNELQFEYTVIPELDEG